MGGLFATISALTNLATQRLLFTSLTPTCRVVIDQTLITRLDVDRSAKGRER